MGSLRLRNKNWYIDYCTGGKRYRECIGPDKKVAQKTLHKRLTEIAEDRFLDKRITSTLTFKEFGDLYMEVYSKPNKKSWKTCDLVRITRLNKTFGKYMLDTITPIQVEDYKKQRMSEVSPATVNRELTCLKHLYNKANQWSKTDKNPAKLVRKLREKNARLRYLTEEEIFSLIGSATGYMRTLLIVALNTGMRRGEILNLKWHDIDYALGVICLLRTKNDERRTVPMNTNVVNALKEHPENPNSEYVFSGKDGLPLRNIDETYKKLLKQNNITDFKFHDLRHTFASRLAMRGVDLNTLRELLGHKTINMTLRYSHLSPSHKKKAVEILSF